MENERRKFLVRRATPKQESHEGYQVRVLSSTRNERESNVKREITTCLKNGCYRVKWKGGEWQENREHYTLAIWGHYVVHHPKLCDIHMPKTPLTFAENVA